MAFRNHYPPPPPDAPSWLKELVRNLEQRDNDLDSSLANRASFNASTNAATVITAGTPTDLVFGTRAYDATGRYDPASGQFYSPERGLYHFHAQVTGTASATSDWELWLVTTQASFKKVYRGVGTASATLEINCPAVYVGRGESAKVQLKGLTGVDTFTLNADSAYNFYMGYHVSPI